MIRVALADDHEIVRSGIQIAIEDDPEIKVLWQAADGLEALEKLKNEGVPDVLILDIRMPVLNGLDLTNQLKNTHQPTLKVMMLSMHYDKEYILKSLQYGADGYLLKDTSKAELNKAIKLVHSGQKYFSGDISDTIISSLVNSAEKPVQVEQQQTDVAEVPSYPLTKRERQILKLIYEGIQNKEIAESLGKSIRTVETHRFNIMKKLEVNNITDLLKKIEREGIQHFI